LLGGAHGELAEEAHRLRSVYVTNSAPAPQGAVQSNDHRVNEEKSLTKIRLPDMAGWAHVGLSATV